MSYTIKLHLEEGEPDYNGTIYLQHRYIILDNEGMDYLGEHVSKELALEIIKEINKL